MVAMVRLVQLGLGACSFVPALRSTVADDHVWDNVILGEVTQCREVLATSRQLPPHLS